VGWSASTSLSIPPVQTSRRLKCQKDHRDHWRSIAIDEATATRLARRRTSRGGCCAALRPVGIARRSHQCRWWSGDRGGRPRDDLPSAVTLIAAVVSEFGCPRYSSHVWV
jgi:hypothetical protein